MATLYREIDALGGTFDPNDERAAGAQEMLDTIMTIMERRGFSEFVEAIPVRIPPTGV